MVIHKRTRLTPIQRHEIYREYHDGCKKVSDLADSYHVSRPTIYKITRRGRHRDFSIHPGTNKRFRCLKYGTKIEKAIEARLKKQARSYNKDYFMGILSIFSA
jgi:transposase-like protein